MKKKLFAFLTAICCLASTIGSFTVFAEEEVTTDVPSYELVLIGIEDSEELTTYYFIDIHTYTSYNSAPTFSLFDYEAEKAPIEGTLEYGSIVELYGLWSATQIGGTNPVVPVPLEDYPVSMKVTGSIFEEGQLKSYTFKSVYNQYGVYDDEGVLYRSDPMYSLFLSQGFDWDWAKPGDEIVMHTYKDVPCIPIKVNPLGDVNSDSTLNVLDVIIMNKHLLTGSDLPALAKARSTGESDLGQCDFNGNGVIDPDDSLSMLKRIIGLETIETE